MMSHERTSGERDQIACHRDVTDAILDLIHTYLGNKE